MEMSFEEFAKLPYEEQLRFYVKNGEERYIWYKKQLEMVFKEKTVFVPGDELTEWYKESLRDSKNREEQYLKQNREALTDVRQGGDGMLFKYQRKPKSEPQTEKIKESVKEFVERCVREARVDVDVEYCKKHNIKFPARECDTIDIDSSLDILGTEEFRKSFKEAFDFVSGLDKRIEQRKMNEDKNIAIKEKLKELQNACSNGTLPSDREINILSQMFFERDKNSSGEDLELMNVMRGFIWGATAMRNIFEESKKSS